MFSVDLFKFRIQGKMEVYEKVTYYAKILKDKENI